VRGDGFAIQMHDCNLRLAMGKFNATVASNCTGASDKVPITAAWRASRWPGTGQQRRARRRGVQSRAQAYVFNVFGWLAEAARG
jgi:hypothetical protein